MPDSLATTPLLRCWWSETQTFHDLPFWSLLRVPSLCAAKELTGMYNGKVKSIKLVLIAFLFGLKLSTEGLASVLLSNSNGMVHGAYCMPATLHMLFCKDECYYHLYFVDKENVGTECFTYCVKGIQWPDQDWNASNVTPELVWLSTTLYYVKIAVQNQTGRNTFFLCTVRSWKNREK